MPDYGEGRYAQLVAKAYEGRSDEDLHRELDKLNTEMVGLELAKNNLEFFINERRGQMNDLSFEILRRAKAVDKNRAD